MGAASSSVVVVLFGDEAEDGRHRAATDDDEEEAEAGLRQDARGRVWRSEKTGDPVRAEAEPHMCDAPATDTIGSRLCQRRRRAGEEKRKPLPPVIRGERKEPIRPAHPAFPDKPRHRSSLLRRRRPPFKSIDGRPQHFCPYRPEVLVILLSLSLSSGILDGRRNGHSFRLLSPLARFLYVADAGRGPPIPITITCGNYSNGLRRLHMASPTASGA